MTIEITGTGGIIEGDLGSANVNVNLDPIYGNFNADTSSSLSNDNDFDDIWDGNGGLFSAWIYPKSDGEGNFGRIADKNQWLFYVRDELSGFVRLNFNHGFSTTEGSWKTTDRVVPVNAWSHVAVFFDSNSASNDPVIYLNGVAQTLTEGTTPAGTRNSDASSDLYIGNNSSGTRGFDGYMMDIKIYKNTAWTQPEIAVLASKINVDKDHPGLPAPGPRLYLWWKAIADATTDSSGSGNNLTASNMGSVVYDAFSVDVYDNSTTTDGTFTITQGKVEGLALSSVDLNGTDDFININNDLESWVESPQKTFAAWVYSHGNSTTARIFNAGYDDSGSKTAFGLGMTLSTVNKPYAFLRDTSAGAIQQEFGDIQPNNTWVHYAIVQDGANDQAFLYQNGVLQATVSNVGEISQATDVSAKMGIHWIPAQSQYFNGQIRDVRLYDYDLSDEQVASLYSGTYPQTPLHHWKLDEGYTSGTTANTAGAFEDSGTGTDYDAQGSGLVNASCVNGTLDLDGTLTIAANGTLSAPRGEIKNRVLFENSGSYIHNNGTFVADAGGNRTYFASGTSGVTFYNFENRANVDIIFRKSCTFENELECTQSSANVVFNSSDAALTFTFGTTTSAGAITMTTPSGQPVKFEGNTTNAVTITGASSLYPVLCTGQQWNFDNGGSGSKVNLANIDYDPDITTGGGGVTITLTGDCEFDAVTVSSGDTLDLNGQRMECSGNFTADTGTTVDFGAGMLITSLLDIQNGTYDNENGASIIVTGSTSGDNIRFNDTSFVGDSTTNILINNGTTSCDWNNSFGYRGNLRIASPYRSLNGTNNKCGNLTVATGGELDGDNDILTVHGDFTTSGGLVNLSAFKGVYDDKDLIEVADHADLDFTNTFTAEIWFKSTRNDVHQYLFDRRGGSSGAVKSWFLYLDTGSGQLGSRIRGASTAAGTTFTTNATNLDDGKWHHAALVYDKDAADGRTKIYIDGKLDVIDDSAEGPLSADDSNFYIGGRYSYEFTWDGNLAEPRIWNVARTQAQIRADMFNSDTLANSTGLVGQWKMTEGTGSTFASTNTNLNGTAVSYSTGSEVAITDAWAGAGTFTYGTSTLVMAKSGTQTICILHNTDVNNLTINDGSTTELLTLGTTNGLIDIQGNLVVNEKIKSHADTPHNVVRMRTGDKTITIGSDVKTTALAEIDQLRFDLSGSNTMNLPESTTKKIDIVNGTVVATGDLTVTSELEIENGTTFNANGNTIAVKNTDVNGGTLDLRNSTLNFSVTSSSDIFTMSGSSTLLSGNTAINGHSSAAKTLAAFAPSGGFEVVGDVKHLLSDTDSDLTVIGSVIGCDVSASGANIRQFFHTLDTQQLLDADEAGDDDLRLEKPTLDNANELQTG